MNEQFLTPDTNQQKIISFTRTDRWLAVIRHHSKRDQRIAALDWNDLAIECRRWPGSVAVVEVDDVNLAAACRFSLDNQVLRSGCGLFAVTDFSSPAAGNALAVAGYTWMCSSPLAATRLFRQIARFHQQHPPNSMAIEAEFRQRLPWKPAGRYADGSFQRTRFSTLTLESAEHSDSLADAENSND